MRHLAGFILVFLCASCGSQTPADRAKAADNIRESVFRYLFEHNAHGVSFLKVDGHDPSDDFLQRFAGLTLPVRKGSKCKTDVLAADKDTGEQGVLFHVDMVKWVRSDEVEATGGYWMGEQGRAVYMFHLKLENGKWMVTGEKLLLIS